MKGEQGAQGEQGVQGEKGNSGAGIVKAITQIMVGVAVGGLLTVATGVVRHETRISVMEASLTDIKTDLRDIKAMLREAR